MGANAANAGVTPGTGFNAQAAARAGTGGGLSLFSPNYPAGQGLTGGFGEGGNKSFADIKAGYAQDRADMASQRAIAEAVGGNKSYAPGEYVPGRGQDPGEAAPPEFQMLGKDNYGMLAPGAGTQYNPAKSTWTDMNWDFSGVDKGWEQYEQDYQKSQDLSQYTPFSPEWMQAAQMQTLRQNTGQDFLHSIQGDKRDPYGYGSDYARFYDQAHGQGALAREANRFARGFAEDDPAFAGYEKGYGQIDWTNAAQVEDMMRRMNMGGTRTAIAQGATSQNKRTDMTEGAIMAALSMGMGALAAPAAASIGYGGTLGASTAAESALYSGLANQMTADALARTAIQGAGSYG